jgi:hypothetical protein
MRPLVYSDTITIRMDADLRRAIDAAAQREGASASEWVRRALGPSCDPIARPARLRLPPRRHACRWPPDRWTCAPTSSRPAWIGSTAT